jgi:hypothetical protein
LNNAGQSGHGSAKYSKAKEVVSCSLNKLLKLCVMFMRLLCLRQCTCAGVVIAVADDEVPVVRRRRCVVYVEGLVLLRRDCLGRHQVWGTNAWADEKICNQQTMLFIVDNSLE